MAGISQALSLASTEQYIDTEPNQASENRVHDHTSTSMENSLATSPQDIQYDPNFTQTVIDATGPKASKRLREVMASLIRHTHDWARENQITIDELMTGIEVLNEAGRMSTDRRNEGLLLSDIIGLESLVDEITYKVISSAKNTPTLTAVLGPFYRPNAPKYPMDSTIVHNIPDGQHAYIHGTVRDFVTNQPIPEAELDIWQAAPNGLYEQQDPDQIDFNLRGRFTTGPDGRYGFYCLLPTHYPLPPDGPSSKLLQLLDRHPMRPAHIHFIVSASGYRPVVTQIFDRKDKYVDNDAVFAVKENLVVDFVERVGDPKATFELQYAFVLAKQG